MKYMFLRFPNGKAKAVTLSYDDGCQQDIKFSKIISDHSADGKTIYNPTLYTV